MKAIVTVNAALPTVDDFIEYSSGESLSDYDIVLFDPRLPYMERINFSGGGSCISIDGARRLQSAMNHWTKELRATIQAGKTIFFLLNDYETDSAASGSETKTRNSRMYNTYSINNYSVLPTPVKLRNAKGKKMKVVDGRFKGLYDVISDVVGYRVIFSSNVGNKFFTTRDGTGVVATVMKVDELPGSIVFLPYFNLSEMSDDDEENWTEDEIRKSNGIVSQLVAIDKNLRTGGEQTPPPTWVSSVRQPKEVEVITQDLQKTQDKIDALEKTKQGQLESQRKALEYSSLLFENGQLLESAIEGSLRLLGYEVENFTRGDLEIDHVVTSPEGVRMIGESEGKDSAAINISKFRQLESNIGEDFEREGINVPAKGLLFGNAYRLTEPDKRKDQFTEKCLINAKRLGTALVKTSDLYDVVLHILDNPDDEEFKQKCRKVIESTEGTVVEFPIPKIGKSKGKKNIDKK